MSPSENSAQPQDHRLPSRVCPGTRQVHGPERKTTGRGAGHRGREPVSSSRGSDVRLLAEGLGRPGPADPPSCKPWAPSRLSEQRRPRGPGFGGTPRPPREGSGSGTCPAAPTRLQRERGAPTPCRHVYASVCTDSHTHTCSHVPVHTHTHTYSLSQPITHMQTHTRPHPRSHT